MTTNPKEISGWEEKFDEVVCPLEKMWADQIKWEEINRWEYMYGFTPEMLRERIKSFIQKVESQAREESRSETLKEIEGIVFKELTGIELNQKPVSGRIIALEEGMERELNLFDSILTRIQELYAHARAKG